MIISFLVSIIMPVYNCEKYLSYAIDSVLSQTYPNWELIIVDDHSTDTSYQVEQHYAARDSRIHSIKNTSSTHGPGATRNIGLKYANGEYIFFMDADDWIEPDLLKLAIQTISKDNADFVQFGFFNEYLQHTTKYLPLCSKEKIYRTDIESDFNSFWTQNRYSLWLSIFKNSIIGTTKFESIAIGEDISFVMDLLCHVNCISYIPKPLYHYRVLDGSTCHKWNDSTIECLYTVWQHQKHFFDSFHGRLSNNLYTELAISNYIWMTYHLCLQYCPLSYKEKKKQLQYAAHKMHIDNYRSKCSLKNHHGIEKLKYAAVKFHFENLLLFLGPLFLKII